MNPSSVPPFGPRHTTTDLGDSLRITLPSRKNWLVILPNTLFVLIWLAAVTAVLAFGGPALLGALASRPETLAGFAIPIGFALVWLGFFSLGGLTALYSVLWHLAGSDVFDVNRNFIRLSRRVPGWGRSKEYSAEHIQDVRVSPLTMPESLWFVRRSAWPANNTGQLAFDYGARTIRFLDADEAEARMVLAEIQQRFPQYRPRA